MKASTFFQPALTSYKTQGQYIGDVTRWREDMNIRVVKTIFYEQLMLPPCNVLFIMWSEVGTSQKLKTKYKFLQFTIEWAEWQGLTWPFT